jgi:putative ABC transport system permease protein
MLAGNNAPPRGVQEAMVSSIDIAIQDLRYAIRGLIRNPVFALTAIGAAALGVGAATTVFSVVDRILFRALPYAHEGRLVSAGMMAPLDTSEFMFASEYFDLRRNPGPFEAATSFQAGAFDCDITEQNPVRLRCLRLESNFLETLGMAPLLGRSFTSVEDQPHGPHVAVISYGLWQSRFAGDLRVIGRTLPIDGATTTIVGVLPANFEMPALTRTDVLIPLALDEATEREGRALRVFARLRPGTTVPQAVAQLQPHFQRALERVPPQFRKEVSLRVRLVRDRQLGDARLASIVLFGSVLAVLLIACANIANLLFARALVRDREFAMRAALGASRVRLMRQTLTESLLLGAIGGAIGCAFAYTLLRIFIAIAPGGLPLIERASIDLRVLSFALAAAVFSALLFGIAPALNLPQINVQGGWRSTEPFHAGLRSVLVTVQIAISMILLTGAGLLLRSLWKLESVPLGLETEHVITAHFILGKQRYSRDAEQVAFYNELEQRLAGLPGMNAAAITDSMPPTGGMRARPLTTIDIEGRPPTPEGTGGMVGWRYITPRYFAALGVPILRGRGFTEPDRDPNAYALVLSETLAHRLFGSEDPIGKHLSLRGPQQGQWFTVIGVAGDVKNDGPARGSDPEYYMLRKHAVDAEFHSPEPPTGWRAASVVALTGTDPKLAARAIRGVIASLDPTLPVEMETMQQRLREVTERPRFNAILLAAFAATGVLLAAVGLFGVMSLLVAQRTREIGVRMALGATPGRIMILTMRHAARWTLAGLLIGLAGSIAASSWLRSLLFQVEPADPGAVGAALLFLAAVAFLAAAGPAYRAASLDPMETLRQE